MKTQNLFIKDGRILLGDFGIAKVLDKTKELANTVKTTSITQSLNI